MKKYKINVSNIETFLNNLRVRRQENIDALDSSGTRASERLRVKIACLTRTIHDVKKLLE